MLLLQAWAVAAFVAQIATARLPLVPFDVPVLGRLRRALVHVCGCG